jgi:hypothetical protein
MGPACAGRWQTKSWTPVEQVDRLSCGYMVVEATCMK